VPDYPATTLAMNKGKYYVLVTVPADLRQHFNGRKQLKQSTGTSDLADAKRRQHNISVELYARLDACKPDVRDMISDMLGWIGDADEVQRMDDAGDLEGLIWHYKTLEYGENPENDEAVDECNRNGAKALELYREWKAKETQGTVESGSVSVTIASEEYLASKPYENNKTSRVCEHALEKFKGFTGEVRLTAFSRTREICSSSHL